MKVYMKPIKMIASFMDNGLLTPIKFKMEVDTEPKTIRVDKITERSEEKLAGNRMMIFRCQSEISGVIKIYELKYEIVKCKWYLYKM